MVQGIRVFVIFFIFLSFLSCLEASRQRRTKYVGKCLNRQGNLKCNSKHVCVADNKLCDPFDMSAKCKCKKLKVRGCEDMIGRSICKSNEACLDKKTSNLCSNKRSKRCKCTVQETPAPGTTPPSGAGCFVAVDLIKIFIPFDHKFHTIKQMPCKECMCMPRYPHYVDFCRPKPNCNSALHLYFKSP